MKDWVYYTLAIVCYTGLVIGSIAWKIWATHQAMIATGFSFWKAFFVFR